MTSCPKCGFELPEGTAECPACGILPAKYRERAAAAAPPPSDAPNPYAPPSAPLVAPGEGVPGEAGRHSEDRGAGITGATLDALASARPWLRFIVGYGFVITILMMVGALGLVVAGAMGDQELGPLALVYVAYGGVGLLMLVPLRRSTVALAGLGQRDPSQVLESFIVAHASFWRRTGILTAVSLVVLILAFVVGIIAGAMSAAGS